MLHAVPPINAYLLTSIKKPTCHTFKTTLIQTKKLITPYFESLLVQQKYGVQ